MPTKENSAGQQQPYDEKGRFASMESGSTPKLSKPIQKAFKNHFDPKSLGVDYEDLKPVSKENEQEFLSGIKTTVNGKTHSYGDEAVKSYIAEVNDGYVNHGTWKDNSPERQKLREKWKNDEIAKQRADRQIKKEKKATYVFGLPASGKSSISDPLKRRDGAFEIDADLIKQHIPEFDIRQGGTVKNTGAVHEESSTLSKQMQSEVMADGSNLVIGKVGGNYEGIKKKIEELKAKGYSVDIVCVDMPPEVALERNLTRYFERLEKNDPNKPARVVNPAEALAVQREYLNTMSKLIDDGLVDNYAVYDNNVARGEHPKLLAKSDDFEEIEF